MANPSVPVPLLRIATKEHQHRRGFGEVQISLRRLQFGRHGINACLTGQRMPSAENKNDRYFEEHRAQCVELRLARSGYGNSEKIFSERVLGFVKVDPHQLTGVS